MQFTAITLAFLANGVFSQAVPVQRIEARDASAVSASVTTIGQSMDSLNQALNSFSGDIKPVSDAADKLASDIQASKAAFDASGTLSIVDSMTLVGPASDVRTKSQTVVTDLNNKKPDIEKANACQVASEKVGAIGANAEQLLSSVAAKMPDGTQDKVKELGGSLNDLLNGAAAGFSPENCKNAS